jgi:peptidoglycan/LPS O-acetylase OafA/YrhL
LNRTPFIDHLRVVLTALVVFHHAAITYGAEGGWYVYAARQGSSPLLVLFCTVNQAFFMGFFFLLAGYFTPGAYDRKGARRFVLDRLVRLGVPLLVFGLLLDPLTVAIARGHDVAGVLDLWGRFLARGWFSSGPLWFAEALLIFAAVFVAVRRLAPKALAVPRDPPGHLALFVAAVAVGVGAFLLRLAFPVGWTIANMQLGYFSSYVLLFGVGLAAARGKWLERVDRSLTRPWLIVSALALAVLIASSRVPGWGSYSGGWSIKAAIYAFFEPFFAWGIILCALRVFRDRFNRPGRWMGFLAARAYTVYIIHPVLLVGATLALAGWQVPALLKFLITGTLACAGCVAVASLILAVPGARRVL